VEIKIGDYLRRKKILDLISISDGWILIKTENSKSSRDFKVKTIYKTTPRLRYYTPKHAHFAIDFYGKICANKDKGIAVFNAIIDIWNRKNITNTIARYQKDTKDLPGYKLDYILYALNWILDQEDINFTYRPDNRQEELDNLLNQLKLKVPTDRLGSQLAISLFCNLVLGEHPVNAFIKANLDVLPAKRSFGVR
jgi:hypothetical protein